MASYFVIPSDDWFKANPSKPFCDVVMTNHGNFAFKISYNIGSCSYRLIMNAHGDISIAYYDVPYESLLYTLNNFYDRYKYEEALW